ncbi:MAG: hypothetical protein IJ849_01985 [Selenomonadaceae bacterium]|nr:hypothetical protein [Selenomonadaceae bacterium]
MRTKWSDYKNTVYDYLKHYKHFKGQIANFDLEIQGINEELKSLENIDAKTAKYGSDNGGGFSELNPIEKIVARKLYLERKLPVLIADRHRLTSLISRIDNALLSLGENERTIIRRKFIDGEKWLTISLDTGYSERRCLDIANRAVKQITGIMFPESVEGQQQFSYVFLNSGQSLV